MSTQNIPRVEPIKDPLAEKREENALRKFKQVLHEIIFMLRSSTGSRTVSLYWVNREREQFVLETSSTDCANTVFQDRVSFENSYLKPYCELEEAVTLQVGKDIKGEELDHYYDSVPVEYLHIQPFINNGQTVALTVMESNNARHDGDVSTVLNAYDSALSNLLHTFFELSDLSEHQDQWIAYEETLETINHRLSAVDLFKKIVEEMQKLLPGGGVSLICRGMDNWVNILNATGAQNAPPLGLSLEERTIVFDALESGDPVFAIHFNGNPRRLSTREPLSNGASMAIPVLLKDRRHAVVLAYNDNPLVFKESNKHKLINLVRVVALRLASGSHQPDMISDLLSNEYSAFSTEVLEAEIKTEISRFGLGTDLKTWFGFATIADLSTIRTRFRLEDLKKLQKEAVARLKPINYEMSGVIGFHSDYVYSFILQGREEQLVERWAKAIKQKAGEPVMIGEKTPLTLNFLFGYTRLQSNTKDAQQALREAKAALDYAVKNPEALTYEYQANSEKNG